MVLLKAPRRFSIFRKKPALFGPLLILLLLVVLIYLPNHPQPWRSISKAPRLAPPQIEYPLLQEQVKFWRTLYEAILNNDPKCEQPPELVVPHALDIPYNAGHPRQRPDILWMEPPDVQRLREAHSHFLLDLKSVQPVLPYNNGTRGIATTAGIDQLPVLVISLHMLRRTGCTLPVEVFLSHPIDYDPDVCENILPSLNAKCLIFNDIFREAHSGVAIHKFQYKIMSVVLSSFEDVLLLDADAFPIVDPVLLFDSPPFNATGLVLWPDFWYSSESPYYFDIVQLDPPLLHERPSIESGAIVYSKSKHAMSLMLASYYNYYGPEYYYPLLSQGAPGQGDKETFAWAAAALEEDYYIVHESVLALGKKDSDGTFYGSAMAQHDPRTDFRRVDNMSSIDGGAEFESAKASGQIDIKAEDNGVGPFFIHANYPKFDPATIFQKEIWGAKGPTMDSNGTTTRCWMDQEEAIELFGFDLENMFWSEIRTVACQYEKRFMSWRYSSGICTRVKKYYEIVFE